MEEPDLRKLASPQMEEEAEPQTPPPLNRAEALQRPLGTPANASRKAHHVQLSSFLPAPPHTHVHSFRVLERGRSSGHGLGSLDLSSKIWKYWTCSCEAYCGTHT